MRSGVQCRMRVRRTIRVGTCRGWDRVRTNPCVVVPIYIECTWVLPAVHTLACSFVDPVRFSASPADAFPRLPPGQCARLIHRGPTLLVYALGDECSVHPFQHVTIYLPLNGDPPRVHWSISRLASNTPNVVSDGRRSLRAQHFVAGHRQRCGVQERIFQQVLCALNATYEGDALRAYQRRALVPLEPTAPNTLTLAHHVWCDVLREYTDRLRRVVTTGNVQELLRVTARMDRLYPVRHPYGCCGRFRRWWWAYRLPRRLRYRYPLLTRQAARALASDVAYCTYVGPEYPRPVRL